MRKIFIEALCDDESDAQFLLDVMVDSATNAADYDPELYGRYQFQRAEHIETDEEMD